MQCEFTTTWAELWLYLVSQFTCLIALRKRNADFIILHARSTRHDEILGTSRKLVSIFQGAGHYECHQLHEKQPRGIFIIGSRKNDDVKVRPLFQLEKRPYNMPPGEIFWILMAAVSVFWVPIYRKIGGPFFYPNAPVLKQDEPDTAVQ